MRKTTLFIFLLIFCLQTAAQQVVDYRYLQSSVKNQNSRGTCTAFAICAALEVQPGLPSDLSEQYLFAKAKYGRLLDNEVTMLNMEDEMLEYYIGILQVDGVISERKMAYDTSSVRYTSDHDMLIKFRDVTKGASMYQMMHFYNVSYKLEPNAYKMYLGAMAQDTGFIKSQLRSGIRAIPVSYKVNGAAWNKSSGNYLISPDSIAAVKLPGGNYLFSAAKKQIPNLVEKVKNNEMELVPIWSNGLFTGGHAVTIVGYNEQGFIIKNSWGADWGMGGYAIIDYDYHMMWCKKAMIINNFFVNSSYAAKAGETYDPREICLKTYPLLLSDGSRNSLTFSFFYEGDKPAPQYSKIHMKFYTFDRQTGQKAYLDEAYVLITDKAYRNGYVTLKTFKNFKWGGTKSLDAEVTFTLKGSNKTITNLYPVIEWRNRTVRPGFMDALKLTN